MIGSPRRVSRPRYARILSYAVCFSAPLAGVAAGATSPDVLTQRSSNSRVGAVADTSLSFQSFLDGTWQKLGSLAVDAAVYAQPLFVSNQLIAKDLSHRDVVIVVSANNTVYAYDSSNGYAQLWSKALPFLPDLAEANLDADCAQMSPLFVSPTQPPTYGIGVQSTPVIDRTAGPNGRVYVSYRTNTSPGRTDATAAQQRIASLDLASGTIVKDAIVGLDTQHAQALRQRASLTLMNGVVYVPFASHCEELAVPKLKKHDPNFDYRGTLVAVETANLNTVGHFDPIAAGSPLLGGGIWQASTGVAADGQNLYFTTGNSLIIQNDPSTVSSGVNGGATGTYLPNSFVKVTPNVTVQGGVVTSVTFNGAASYFTPYRSEWHNRADLDLGSAGVILPTTGEVVGGGKEGILYVLSSGSMGGYSPSAWTPALVPACVRAPDPNNPPLIPNLCDSSCNSPDLQGLDAVTQKWSVGRNVDCAKPNMANWLGWPHIHGTPAFGNVPFTNVGGSLGPAANFLYVWPEKDQLQAYKRVGGSAPYLTTPGVANVLAPNRGMPGGMLTLATSPTAAVVFAAVPLEAILNAPGVNAGGLVAVSGIPSADGSLAVLWGDYPNDVAANNGPYVHSKFAPPTVANGKVFLPTFSGQVNVYGPGSAPVLKPSARVAAFAQDPSHKVITAAAVERTGTIAVFGKRADQTGTFPQGDWGARLATLAGAGIFPPGGGVQFDTLGSNLALFAVGTDHQLRMYTTSISGNSTSWNPPTIVWTGTFPGTGASLPAGAPIATVHDGSNLDLFVVDSSGDIQLLTSVASGTWPATNLTSSDPTKFPSNGTCNIVADVQNGVQADVFAVDNTGKFRVYAHGLTGWAGFKPATTVTMVAGANLATGHRTSNELDVYAIGGAHTYDRPSQTCSGSDDTGCLRVFAGVGANPWTATTVSRAVNPGQSPNTPIDFAPGVPGGPITAAWQGATALNGTNQIDVFFVSQTGSVTEYFQDGNGAWYSAVVTGPATGNQLFISRLKSVPGSFITAVRASSSGDTMGVFTPGNRQEPTWSSGVFGAMIANGAVNWTNPLKAL